MNTIPRIIPGRDLSEAVSSLGFHPPQRIIAGRWSDFSTNGKRTDDAGRCLLFSDGQGGIIWDHRLGEQWLWFADSGQKLTPDEQYQRNQKAKAAIKAANAAENLKHEAAAGKAKRVLDACKPAGADHPYLVRKQVSPAGLLEIDAGKLQRLVGYSPKAKGEPLIGRVLVAPIDIDGSLCSLEFIDAVGRKSALAGGKKAGGFWTPEPLPDVDFVHVFAITEGVATAASVGGLTGWNSISALSAGNMPAVAKSVRARFPAAQLLIVADTGNGGDAARQAADAVGAALAVPVLPAGSGSDFNDLAAVDRAEAKRQLLAALHPRDADLPPTPEPPEPGPERRIKPTPFVWRDPASIPRREWVYGRHLSRKFVSLTVAPGAVGKSSLVIADAISMASDRDLLGTRTWDGPKRVWIWNLEDPRDEIERRVVATMLHHGVDPGCVGDRLFIDSGRDQSLCIGRQERSGAIIQ